MPMELVQKQRDFFATQKTKAISFRKKALKRLQKEIISREDDIAEAIYKDFKNSNLSHLWAKNVIAPLISHPI